MGGGRSLAAVVTRDMSHPRPPPLSGSTQEFPVCHDVQDDIVAERQLVQVRFGVVSELCGSGGLARRGVVVHVRCSGRVPVSVHTCVEEKRREKECERQIEIFERRGSLRFFSSLS